MKKTKLFLLVFSVLTLMSTVVFATDDIVTTAEEAAEGNQLETDVETPTIEECDRVFTGENIQIDELIDGNVVAIGNNVVLNGGVARDLYVIAENFTMGQDAVIYGNLYILASDIKLNGGIFQVYAVCDNFALEYFGETQADLKVMAKEVSIDGVVGRHAYLDANSVIIETYGEIMGNLTYTSKSEAIYRETIMPETTEGEESEPTAQPEINTTTDIPKDNVKGERNFTKRDKDIYNSDKEIIRAVDKLIKKTKDIDEEKMKSNIMAYIFNDLGVKANNERINSANIGKTVKIPLVVVYIDIIIIVLLVVAVVLPIIKKKERVEVQNPNQEKNK